MDDLEVCMDRLQLHQVTFDDLFDGIPEFRSWGPRFDGTQEVVGR